MGVVILHGWSQNRELWKGLADQLGKNAVSIDLPGFGGEKLISTDWGVPEYASWVCKKIKKRNVVLIGHSFGGRVAAEIASKKPSWLKALVLSGSPCLYRPTFKIKLKIRIYKIAKIFLPNKLRSMFFPEDLKKAESKGLEKIFRKVVPYDQTRQLQNIYVPTLLIWGENDDTVPLYIANEMKSLIRNSELKIIQSAGHNSSFDNPILFYGYVEKFIESI